MTALIPNRLTAQRVFLYICHEKKIRPSSIKWRNQTTLFPVSNAALNHTTSERETELAKHKISLEKPSKPGD